jgi:hypothetical protein
MRFKHDPLDHHGSAIRLVKIYPSTEPGLRIQCDIRIASTDSEYICLSYVWGDEQPGEWILVNDKKFWARQNLFDFLNSASGLVEMQSKWIWIDAICIDQENFKEREHQVQQMGHIFSQATTVVSWLGNDHAIARFLHFAQTGTYQYEWGRHSFNRSPYWDRAWTTQEVALARRISFMARKMVLDSDQLPASHPELEAWSQLVEYFTYMRGLSKDTNLFQLLSRSRDKKCKHPRDRVFSLLALCCDGANVHVDYSISHALLAWDILKSCKHGFCLCSINFVHRALDLNALSTPCPRGFTPAGESRCGSVTLPILWRRTTSLLGASDENMRPLRENEHDWGSWDRRLEYSKLPIKPESVARASRWFQPLQQGEHWLENHLVWWKLQNGSQEEPWVLICVSMAAICPSLKGWFKLLVNVNTGCAHYQPALEDFFDNREEKLRPCLQEAWLPKPGGHDFCVRLPSYAKSCKVVLPINFWHVVSERTLEHDTPVECCSRASMNKIGSRSHSDGITLELCSEAATPGIYGI